MHLTDCFIEIFAFVSRFQETVEETQPSFEEVSRTLDRLIAQGESLAALGAWTRDEFDRARFAVFAWTDETLGSGAWRHKQQWLNDRLQRRYFQTADAGEEFFAHLHALERNQGEVREVYYLCLALGFTGRFCKPGDEYQLEQLKVTHLRLLFDSPGDLPAPERDTLFPEAYPTTTDSPARPRRRRLPLAPATVTCLVGPLLLFAILFAIYHFTLSTVTENYLKTVAY